MAIYRGIALPPVAKLPFLPPSLDEIMRRLELDSEADVNKAYSYYRDVARKKFNRIKEAGLTSFLPFEYSAGRAPTIAEIEMEDGDIALELSRLTSFLRSPRYTMETLREREEARKKAQEEAGIPEMRRQVSDQFFEYLRSSGRESLYGSNIVVKFIQEADAVDLFLPPDELYKLFEEWYEDNRELLAKGTYDKADKKDRKSYRGYVE